jgi:hypothetical protein
MIYQPNTPRKQIIFYVLCSLGTVTHAIDTHKKNYSSNTRHTFFCDDILSQLTQQVCTSHCYNPIAIKKHIHALSLVNKAFNDYYNKKTVIKHIIRLCSLGSNTNDRHIAHMLQCRTITAEIERLTRIACNQKEMFSAKDLQDPWYLNMTTTSTEKPHAIVRKKSLLYIVSIEYHNVKKTISMLKNIKNVPFDIELHQNILRKITKQTYCTSEAKNSFAELLIIAELLLEKKAHPDGRITNEQDTALMYATATQHKELAYLLLKHGADPYALCHLPFMHKKYNALDLTGEEEWLKTMIDEMVKKEEAV